MHFHLTICHSFRLKLGVSHDHCRSSSVGPATHERDRAAQEHIARQRRIDEAGDSVPGSQDSGTQGVENLQLTDTPATHVTLPTPAPPPMPNSRRPAQLRARQQHEYLRCAQEPQTTASCCTWFRSTVGNSSSKKALPSCANSTVRRVFSVTQSDRGGVIAAATAKGILLPETSLLAIPFRSVDNLDPRMQRPLARPPLTRRPFGLQSTSELHHSEDTGLSQICERTWRRIMMACGLTMLLPQAVC